MSSDTAAVVPANHALPALSDAGEGLTFTMSGATMRLIADAASTDGRFAIFEQVTPEGWGPPRHVHAREDEIVYVLEGTYEFSLGDGRRTLTAGGCAILPRGVPHGFLNVGPAPGRFLCLVAPGGLEAFFMAVGKCSPPPSLAQLAEMATPFGLTLLPPGA